VRPVKVRVPHQPDEGGFPAALDQQPALVVDAWVVGAPDRLHPLFSQNPRGGIKERLRGEEIILAFPKPEKPGFVAIEVVVRAVDNRRDASDRLPPAARDHRENFPVSLVERGIRLQEFGDAAGKRRDESIFRSVEILRNFFKLFPITRG